MVKEIIQNRRGDRPGGFGGLCSAPRGIIVGMGTAIVDHVGQSAGISSRCKSNAISRILERLIRQAKSSVPIWESPKSTHDRRGITRDGQSLEVSPAEQAGVQSVRMRVGRIAPSVIRRSLDPSPPT